MLAARLKAQGVAALVIEKNKRIGDNLRGGNEALSLHLHHWAGEYCKVARRIFANDRSDHFAYMLYPEHWPTYLSV
jgi:flavin-dependent dehydrogenase